MRVFHLAFIYLRIFVDSRKTCGFCHKWFESTPFSAHVRSSGAVWLIASTRNNKLRMIALAPILWCWNLVSGTPFGGLMPLYAFPDRYHLQSFSNLVLVSKQVMISSIENGLCVCSAKRCCQNWTGFPTFMDNGCAAFLRNNFKTASEL